jgi:hypothetical protein
LTPKSLVSLQLGQRSRPTYIPQEVAARSPRRTAIPAAPVSKADSRRKIPAYLRSTRKHHDRLSRRRSRVRVPSLPLSPCKTSSFVAGPGVNDRRLLSSRTRPPRESPQ